MKRERPKPEDSKIGDVIEWRPDSNLPALRFKVVGFNKNGTAMLRCIPAGK